MDCTRTIAHYYEKALFGMKASRDNGLVRLRRGRHKRSHALLVARIFVVMCGAFLLVSTFVTEEQSRKMNLVLHDRQNEIKKAEFSGMPLSQKVSSNRMRTNQDNDHETQGPWPRIAWLMSFPNSGTSYTAQMLRSVTFTRCASNYGEDNLDANGESVPVYRGDWNGPFYVDPTSLLKQGYKNPTKYVLTKTHCGGYRQNAGPELYVESTHSFRRRCFETKFIQRANATDTSPSLQKGRYNPSSVHKAIHLIRNPYDNIVSRFHLEAKRSENITKTKAGFREFCEQMDERWRGSERASIVYDEAILDAMEKVPCHADFLRYVEWHNMAFVTTADLGIETMVLHYEDYGIRFEETTRNILDFLELEAVAKPRPFVAGKQYTMKYYTAEERAAVKQVMELLSLRMTWANIMHYFP